MGKGRQAVPVMNILIAPAPDQAPGINEALLQRNHPSRMGKGRQAVPVMNILIAPAPDQAPGINEALLQVDTKPV